MNLVLKVWDVDGSNGHNGDSHDKEHERIIMMVMYKKMSMLTLMTNTMTIVKINQMIWMTPMERTAIIIWWLWK